MTTTSDALMRGEIPPEAMQHAERLAAIATRRTPWCDPDELLSAAGEGVWQAATVAARDGIRLTGWQPWVGRFVWRRLRDVRRSRASGLKAKSRARLLTGRGAEVGLRITADPTQPDPSEGLEEDEFWHVALRQLSQEQVAMVQARFREGKALPSGSAAKSKAWRDLHRALGFVEDALRQSGQALPRKPR